MELERQEKTFKHEQLALKKETIKVFETVVNLECDKILETIRFKTMPDSIEQLNVKRTEINDLIKDLIHKHDSDKQIRKAFDSVKTKITMVLA